MTEDEQDYVVTERALRSHVNVLGGSDAARGRVVDALVRRFVTAGSGCVVLDGSGGTARTDAVKRAAAASGIRVRVVDLRGTAADAGDTFDPFAGAAPDVVADCLEGIVAATGSDAVGWGSSTRAFREAWFECLVAERGAGGPGLRVDTMLRDLFPDALEGLCRPMAGTDAQRKAGRTLGDVLTAIRDRGIDLRSVTTGLEVALRGLLERHARVFVTDEPTVDLGRVLASREVVVFRLPGADDPLPAHLVVSALMAHARRATDEFLATGRGTHDVAAPARTPLPDLRVFGVVLSDVEVDAPWLAAYDAGGLGLLGISLVRAAGSSRSFASLFGDGTGPRVDAAGTWVLMRSDRVEVARAAVAMTNGHGARASRSDRAWADRNVRFRASRGLPPDPFLSSPASYDPDLDGDDAPARRGARDVTVDEVQALADGDVLVTGRQGVARRVGLAK